MASITHPQAPFTYQGVDIPVIDDISPREDLLRYIRILEARLDLTHVYSMSRDAPEGVVDAGVVLPYDLPEHRDPNAPGTGLLRVSNNQAERVAMLASGIDRIGCLEIHEKLSRRHIHDDAERADGDPEDATTTKS